MCWCIVDHNDGCDLDNYRYIVVICCIVDHDDGCDLDNYRDIVVDV